ncbi:hypothetical protein IZ6_09990 [Terrihabitans soli]|uniref:Uncharacterized protein n=1 Tax=Terrihabitans soli TaxID=708113 RepID=A0A6S6QJ32_9HYPH|nr:hypothetical protein [Terrihabitans soli]BCJ90264.1 hypothetical protein IZ6_09990 [Terrihabitans soli]
MRKALFAACALAALPLLHEPAAAQPRASYGDCRDLSASYGPDKLWWGRFSGGRKSKWGFNDGGIEYKTTELCFTSRSDCEAWLYRLKSDWQYMPRWNECGRGYRPGRPPRPF